MFKLDILEVNNDVEVIKVGEKTVYNTDDKVSLNTWVKEKSRNDVQFPNFKSALSIGEKERKFDPKSFGFLVSNGNSIEKNISNCYVIPGPPNNNKAGTVIYESNFIKCVMVLSSSILIKGGWVNFKDEYLKPNENGVNFTQFGYDSIILSIFSNKLGQSSLRQVEYKDKLWDIKNEFFWLSVEHMKKLGDDNGFDELYNDARTDVNRFVYKKLYGEEKVYDKLSIDARLVLDKANELVNKSIKMRRLMANEQNHLHCWDAGYSQLKLVWKEYFSEDFKEFRTLYKNLEDRMRPLVYELGFLLK